MDDYKKSLKKIWHFIWEDNSVWSWIANIAIAFILIKFIVYPGLGFALNTTHPVVAVVSGSMEHDGSFSKWWENAQNGYSITKGEFERFPIKNGFNKGDIIFLKKAENINRGDVIVFRGFSSNPIIHRTVKINDNDYQTKGDNYRTNCQSYAQLGETSIKQKDIIGKAFFKIPYLGWLKIGFTDLINTFR